MRYIALALIAACMPPKQPMAPLPPRTESVAAEQAIEGLSVDVAPADAAGWRVVVRNDTDALVSLVWDESTFVTASGESGGRLIRGDTRKMDIAKPMTPTPVPARATASEVVFIEKLADNEEMESRYAMHNARYGGISPEMARVQADTRAAVAKTIDGGTLSVTVQMADAKRTWVGRVRRAP